MIDISDKGELCEMMIKLIRLSDDARNTLLKINCVARSENEEVRISVKDLFLVCPSGREVRSIGKYYERIITCNRVYPVRGERTYLALAFPASGTDMDYKEFFASPALAAATQNYFTGVFLISFEQWAGAGDLIKSPAFAELTRFIDSNKPHMSFVFHVTPDFRDKQNLYKELGRHVNLCSIEHMSPDKEYIVDYIDSRFIETGIRLDEEGRRELRGLLEEKMNAAAEFSMDYRTLEQFAENIIFEVYAQFSLSQKEKGVVGQEEIRAIADYIELPDTQSPYRRTLGFSSERGPRHV